MFDDVRFFEYMYSKGVRRPVHRRRRNFVQRLPMSMPFDGDLTADLGIVQVRISKLPAQFPSDSFPGVGKLAGARATLQA